jgi:hypothetical protein
MTGILAKYADLRVHIDRQRAIDLQQALGRRERSALDTIYVGSRTAGKVFLLDSEGEPTVVLELVVSPAGGDSVATLYHGHPIFNNRGEYLKAREEMIELVLDLVDAGPQGIAIHCPVRGRPTHVRDLSFKQLVDLAQATVDRMQGVTKH